MENKAYIIKETGTSSVLQKVNLKVRNLPDNFALVKHHTIGISYYDIEAKRGYRNLKTPLVLGCEGAGEILEVNDSSGQFKKGDRVVYATAPMGSYCHFRNIALDHLIKIPDWLSYEDVTGFFFKGLTAHYLAKRVYKVDKNTKILIQAAAGGVGTILTQIAKEQGAMVIGTASREDKVNFALESGCDHVINYSKEDLISSVIRLTKQQGVDVLYDGVGKDTFDIGLSVIAHFGLMVSYGFSSGLVKNFNIQKLTDSSLFLTCPSVFKYKAFREELLLSSKELFDLRKQNIIKNNITMIFEFDEIPQIHELMEKRETYGSIIVKI